MSKLIDLTGKKYGRLTVIERAEDYISPKGIRHRKWNCRCECGSTKPVRQTELLQGKTKSCGCLQKEQATKRITQRSKKHGKKGTKLYNVWKSMKQRCLNPNDKSYHNYGGRGITICDEWARDFQTFFDWSIRHGYREGLSIDRINNDQGYEPGNCQWTTVEKQNKNTRQNHHMTIRGETKTIAEWCNFYGVSRSTVYSRLARGQTPEEALGIHRG